MLDIKFIHSLQEIKKIYIISMAFLKKYDIKSFCPFSFPSPSSSSTEAKSMLIIVSRSKINDHTLTNEFDTKCTEIHQLHS